MRKDKFFVLCGCIECVEMINRDAQKVANLKRQEAKIHVQLRDAVLAGDDQRANMLCDTLEIIGAKIQAYNS